MKKDQKCNNKYQKLWIKKDQKCNNIIANTTDLLIHEDQLVAPDVVLRDGTQVSTRVKRLR